MEPSKIEGERLERRQTEGGKDQLKLNGDNLGEADRRIFGKEWREKPKPLEGDIGDEEEKGKQQQYYSFFGHDHQPILLAECGWMGERVIRFISS